MVELYMSEEGTLYIITGDKVEWYCEDTVFDTLDAAWGRSSFSREDIISNKYIEFEYLGSL